MFLWRVETLDSFRPRRGDRGIQPASSWHTGDWICGDAVVGRRAGLYTLRSRRQVGVPSVLHQRRDVHRHKSVWFWATWGVVESLFASTRGCPDFLQLVQILLSFGIFMIIYISQRKEIINHDLISNVMILFSNVISCFSFFLSFFNTLLIHFFFINNHMTWQN